MTGREAKTIHRLLEAQYGERVGFMKNERNPIECDAIVVDEMSMVDTPLFEGLLRALKMDTRIILVGDFNQLPSVGPGNILHDLIESRCIHTVALTEIFRQAAKSLIVQNAHRIVGGQYPVLDQKDNDFFI